MKSVQALILIVLATAVAALDAINFASNTLETNVDSSSSHYISSTNHQRRRLRALQTPAPVPEEKVKEVLPPLPTAQPTAKVEEVVQPKLPEQLKIVLPTAIRINVGSTEDFVDSDGQKWDGDKYFLGNGATYSKCPMDITNTTDDTLYCKERYYNKWVHNKPFRYEVPVQTNGYYTVKLHFAEIHYEKARERLFDVWVGGKLVVRNLDIYNEVGFATALTIPVVTRSIDSMVSIELISRVENPKICGIEIIEASDYVAAPTSAPTEQLFVKRISAGATENWEDDKGDVWESDKFFNNSGAVHWLCPLPINGTELDSLYCKYRYFNKWVHSGPYRYDIPVPKNGTYNVKLHFAESSYQVPGGRIFDVLVGGKPAFKNLDIIKEAGYLTALILPTVAYVTNGVVSIEFISKVENPNICAIEILESAVYIPPPTEAPTKKDSTIRISAGGMESYIDRDGNTWESDQYFSTGGTHANCPLPINGTELDPLYCKERFFNKWVHSGPYRYVIPVSTNGTYNVKLHFAEIVYSSSGKRVFDVLVGGKMVFKNFDIYKEAGYLTAFILPVITTTTNGLITIEVIPRIENPKISAIEIVELPDYVAPPTAAPAPKAFVTRISAGATESWEDDNGNVWESDKYFDDKGEVFGSCPDDIKGTTLDSIYCKERYFNKWKFKAPFRYEIPVPRSTYYSVKLHFAETVKTARGERIFDVLVGGKVILGSLDIFAEVGYKSAFVLPTIFKASTGFVNIEFVPKVEHPKICGIEILELPDYIPPPTAAPVARPFEILINAGAVDSYVERSAAGRTWMADQYFIGGGVLFRRHYDVTGTIDDEVYHIERNGEFRYEIPVPDGTYEINLHLTELHWKDPNMRRFDISIENEVFFRNVDIVKVTGGIRRAWIIKQTMVITDGLISMEFTNSIPKLDMPKLSGVEIKFLSTSTEKINPFPMLINVGGNDYVERNSTRSWLSDRHFVGGTLYNHSKDVRTARLTNPIYHTGRYGGFRYEIPVPEGTYQVILHFAETSLTTVGQRVFHINVEDTTSYQNFDILSRTNGTAFVPLTVASQVVVRDGLLSIAFAFTTPGRNSPIVNGIEIIALAPTNVQSTSPTKAPTGAPILAPIGVPVSVPSSTPRTCSVPRITKNSWTTPFSQYPIHVAEPAGELIGNHMVIFSGFKSGYIVATPETYALDLSVPTAVWTRMDDMPFAAGITHQGIVVIGTKAYLCGGYIGGSLGIHTDKCFVYDHSIAPGTGQQWSTITPLPMGGRSGGGMIYDSTLNAIIYAGGSQRSIPGQPGAIDYKDTWMYSLDNPNAGWVAQSKMPFYGNHMNAVSVVDSTGKERHYIFGGQVGDYELWGNVATMYEYVASTDTWIKRTSMPFARGHSTAAVRAIGCGFVVAGGRTNKGLTGEITYYDTGTDTWQSIGSLPVDIHTNVCVITKTGLFRCESGWVSGTFSTETQIVL